MLSCYLPEMVRGINVINIIPPKTRLLIGIKRMSGKKSVCQFRCKVAAAAILLNRNKPSAV